MFKSAKVMFMYTETSLHCGSGSSLGVVDLPIQREKHTDYPVNQASGVKGCVREWFEVSCSDSPEDRKRIVYAFGPDFGREGVEAFAGAATFTDSRLLLFPVRSLSGLFAYTTSRFALSRFKRDAAIAGITDISWSVPDDAGGKAIGAKNSKIVVEGQRKIVLEEYAYEFEDNSDVEAIAKWFAENAIPQGSEYSFWRDKIETDIIILPDNIFTDFVRQSTEVQARVRIDDETKTVAKHALFYEEALPSDSLMYSVVLTHDPACDSNKRPDGLRTHTDVMAFLCRINGKRLQFGGNATIGKGIVSINYLNRG